VNLLYTDADRAVIGSIVPTEKKLILPNSNALLASEYFAERREIGLINTGAAGNVIVDRSRMRWTTATGCISAGEAGRSNSRTTTIPIRRDFF